ncbi:hypothetical protein DACRYDRAFT_21212 [Dacryopinax primogenitus]|uniref:Uncharacterized protein n=1 Tax=Dacryopinax primogenitus (strain DJM 731) TaxID=1858805 RepID=M5G0H3_DACPD|nr:uncharacterized protein DACRYDRAFT_21212 [Dacryopinax primogenitus]EJU03746.1 hypothetical protein DACRYDRAFT_21212 [Dacryopinax primogenitus]
MRLVGIRAALSCVAVFGPGIDQQTLSNDWQTTPLQHIHYILFSVGINEMNCQVASGGDLATLCVVHDLIYQFMDVYIHHHRTGQLLQLSVPLTIPTCEQMLAYLAAVCQGVLNPDPSSTSSMDTSSTLTFSPAVELPYISHLPSPILSPDPNKSMLLIQHLLEDVSVPNTLCYLTTTCHLTPPLAFVSAPSMEMSLPHPEISWHPSHLSKQSSDEAFLEQYVGPCLPVTMLLPAINKMLPLAFLVYFYELGSQDATLLTLDISLVPE